MTEGYRRPTPITCPHSTQPHSRRAMIVVSGTITLGPDNVDDALAAIAELVPPTLAEEGCISYGFWHSPTEPGCFRVFEEWENQAALDGHFAAPHMAAFLGAMGGFGVTGTEIWRYDGAEKSRLM